MTTETREVLMDELREVALDIWRTRWEEAHTPEEMEAAIAADSSEGGHPYWAEPYTDAEYGQFVDAIYGVLGREGGR